MATPQSTTSQDIASGSSKKAEQITFRFCSECSNMLYPKEDEDAHKLQFTCRTCQYTEDAQTTCVFRNILNTSAGETAGVTQDVGSDPTVSAPCSPVVCLCCGLLIHCVTCGQPMNHIDDPVKPVGEVAALRNGGKSQQSYGKDVGEHTVLEKLACPWNNDPFDEYDEELMPEHPPSDDTSISDSSDATEMFCTNGDMVLDL